MKQELRLADYTQNRRFPSTSAFGQTSTFGGTTSGTTSAFGGFGSTGAATTGGFGSTNQQPTSTFGQSPFGATTNTGGTGAFGTPATATTGAFAQNTTQPSAFGSGTTGAFGGNTTGGAFGTGTSAFGANTGSGAFGQKSAFGTGLSGGAFGSNTSAATPGGGAFGSTATTFPASSGTGAFGSNIATPQNTSGWQGFGSTIANTGTTGAFGTNTSAQDNKSVFGGFGGATNTSTTTPASGGTFGGFGGKLGGTTSTFGGFGGGTGTAAFGQTPTNTGTGPFGGNTAMTSSSTGLGLGGFGANTGTAGAFGNTGTGLFGSKPSTTTSPFSLGGSTLGSGTSTTTGGFGTGTGGFGAGSTSFGLGTQQPQQQSTFGAGPTGGPTFFSTPQQPQPLPTLATAPQPNPLQQSILSSPYGTNPLFQFGGASTFGGDSTKPIAPIATLLPKDSKDEKTPALIAGFRLAPSAGGSTKSRFSLGPSSSPLTGSPFSRSKRDVLGLTPTKIGTPGSVGGGGNLELTPEAFVVPRKGLKSLEISRTKRDLGITGSAGEIKRIEADGIGSSSSSGSNVDPRLEREARERERQAIDNKRGSNSKKIEGGEKPTLTNGPVTAQQQAKEPSNAAKENVLQDKAHSPSASVGNIATTTGENPDLTTQEEGSYWTIPSMHTILSSRDVRGIANFVVGRKGYGQVRFLSPVDLSGVRSIPDIPGQIVVFDRKICTVYPDETSKPPVGKGLNVPAVITLEQCWPVSKETRQPILDVENPRFVAHVERLKRQPDTEFLDYIADSGSWVFKVGHF